MKHTDEIVILLVEDDAADAALFEETLRHAGDGVFAVRHVRTIEEAYPRLSVSRDHDLVVLDLHLPDADGLEALRALADATQDTPVVVHTGHADLMHAALAVRAGAQDVIFKGTLPAMDLVRTLVLAIERFARTQHLHHELRRERSRSQDLTRTLEGWRSGRMSVPDAGSLP